MTLYPFKIKIASNNNEFARHCLDMGVDVGSTDLTISYRWANVLQVLYLELKTKNGRLLDSQIEWNAEFDEHFASVNCQRAVAYGFEKAKIICTAFFTQFIIPSAPARSNPSPASAAPHSPC